MYSNLTMQILVEQLSGSQGPIDNELCSVCIHMLIRTLFYLSPKLMAITKQILIHTFAVEFIYYNNKEHKYYLIS